MARAPFAEIAKANSDGATAADGGRRDWTNKGSLVCEALDRNLFTLPLGQLSPIIEGPTGYHIIRVTTREEAKVRPFLEAQIDISKKMAKERSDKAERDYMAELKARTPMWTKYDNDPPSAKTAARPQPPPR